MQPKAEYKYKYNEDQIVLLKHHHVPLTGLGQSTTSIKDATLSDDTVCRVQNLDPCVAAIDVGRVNPTGRNANNVGVVGVVETASTLARSDVEVRVVGLLPAETDTSRVVLVSIGADVTSRERGVPGSLNKGNASQGGKESESLSGKHGDERWDRRR